MLHAGLADEVRQIFIPDADYTKGIRRSIIVPEMDRYFVGFSKCEWEKKRENMKSEGTTLEGK